MSGVRDVNVKCVSGLALMSAEAVTSGTGLHGEGVITAVRLQAICPSGGICISRTAYECVRNWLGGQFVPFGVFALKNIPRPIEVLVLRPEEEASQPPALGHAGHANARLHSLVPYWLNERQCRSRVGRPLPTSRVQLSIQAGEKRCWWMVRAYRVLFRCILEKSRLTAVNVPSAKLMLRSRLARGARRREINRPRLAEPQAAGLDAA